MVEEEAAYLPHRQTKGTVVVLVVFWLSWGSKIYKFHSAWGQRKKGEKPVYNPIVLL